MLTFEMKTSLACSAQRLYRWHLEPGAFETLTPPWEPVEVVDRPPCLKEGAVVTLRVRIGPVPIVWEARHTDFETDRCFVDEQLKGPFRVWRHTHRFKPLGEQQVEMVDSISYRLPGGGLVDRLAEPLVRARLRRMFAYRHQQLVGLFGRV